MKSQITYCLLVLASLVPNWLAAQDQLKIKDSNGNVLFEAREDGVLIRKMTTAVRTAVAPLDSTDNGLMVYDTDTKSLWLWLDSTWTEIDGVDLVNDADTDPTNELQSWLTLSLIPACFADGIDDVNDADNDPTNELQTWTTLPGVPEGFADGTDDVNDADNDPTNELDTWSTLPGKPAGFEDGIDDVNDADNDPTNERNTSLTRTGTQISLADSGGSLSAEIGWAVSPGKVFNQTDQIGIGISTPASKLHVENGAVLFNGATGATPIVGAGTRMMWIPAKAAFRSGTIAGTQWDDANIGLRSFVAGGLTNIASGINAFTGGGFLNTASGVRTFIASGQGNTASNDNAFAAGLDNVASGVTSFVSGRQSVASGTQSFAAGYGLAAKSFGETVFGSYNSDYTPASTTGFDNTDRLFVIGNGTSTAARSNAMTILKDGKVGFGTDKPKTGLHVVGNLDSTQHVMIIENQNPDGNGLKIKIDGNHPLWVELTDTSGFFVPTLAVPTALSNFFEPTTQAIKNYLLNGTPIGLDAFNFNNVFAPGSIFEDMGLTEMASAAICRGSEVFVDLFNGVGWEGITLPDLALDGMPASMPDIPVNFPQMALGNINLNIPDPCLTVGPYDFCVPIPTVTIPLSSLNDDPPISTFNTAINGINSGIGTVNTSLEDAYGKLKSGLTAIDGYTIPLPSIPYPQTIGPITCPDPNPFENLSFSFEGWNQTFGFVDPLSKDNEFITFVDKGDRKLGAITAKGFNNFAADYFKKEKVMEIGSHVVGLFSDDGNIVENVMKLGKDVFDFIKESNKIGVAYESGFGDYAEWLERENHAEEIGYGDIVGIRGGKISLSLENAEQIMVVSKAPIVLGNAPEAGSELNGNDVAFIGQVPVKVMGPVKTGDYIVGNPATPGFGIAVSADNITPEQFARTVGKSWETNLLPGFKYVNTIVGMHNNGWVKPIMNMQQRIDEQEASIQSMLSRLDAIENVSRMANTSRSK